MLAINCRNYLCRLLVLNVFVGFSMVSSANDYKYRVMGVDEFRANKSNASLDTAGKPKESFTYEANLYPNCEKTSEDFGPTFTIRASAKSASNEQNIIVVNRLGEWIAHVVDNEIKSVERYSAHNHESDYYTEGLKFAPTIRQLILDIYKCCHSKYARMKGEGSDRTVNVMYEF